MPSLAASVRAFTKLARDLPGFLATPLADREAAEVLEARLARREQAFVDIFELIVLSRPASPVARLLANAGVGPGDLLASVRTRGLEATLLQLHAGGARLTLQEMRGRTPIVRPGLEIEAAPADFDNPFLTGAFDVVSGGSTGGRNRSTFDLATAADEAVYWSLLRQAFGLQGRPLAAWYPAPPGVAGIMCVFHAAKVGEPAERWFSQTPLRWSRHEARYTTLARYLTRASHGSIPRIEHVPPERVEVVVGWIAGHRAAGRAPVLMCTPSTAARTCAAALAAGVDITGTFFRCGGEPYTEAKDAAIRSAGCSGASRYAATELGGAIGVPCGRPVEPGEVHVCTDRLALVEVEARHAGGESINVLAGTTFSATSPKLVINLETDDTATVDRRACGCLFEQLGLTTHLRGIRSHAKLTVEGMHFLGEELVRLLEEELPQRFGGGPTSYQLDEHEDESGRTRVLVVVSPAVGAVDERALTATVLDVLAAGGPAQKMMSEVWRQAGTVGVVRREPATTAASKMPSLVRSTA